MRGLVAAVAAAALIVVATPAPAEPAPGSTDARAAIGAIVAAQDAAWQRGDADAYSARVRPDVVFTNIVGLFAVGKAPFVAQHARIFATIYKGTTLSQTIDHIAFPRPDVAIVDTVARVNGAASLPPGVQPVDGALQTRLEQVMVRDERGWWIASYHNVAVNPAAIRAVTSPPR